MEIPSNTRIDVFMRSGWFALHIHECVTSLNSGPVENAWANYPKLARMLTMRERINIPTSLLEKVEIMVCFAFRPITAA
jgi:hypothetical protein